MYTIVTISLKQFQTKIISSQRKLRDSLKKIFPASIINIKHLAKRIVSKKCQTIY
jgi:hypothetical protein